MHNGRGWETKNITKYDLVGHHQKAKWNVHCFLSIEFRVCIYIYITLHYIALHYITLPCVTLYCITLYYIMLYYYVLYCIELYCIALYCIVL